MARSFCLMMMAVVVSVGCGDDKTTKRSEGGGNEIGNAGGVGGLSGPIGFPAKTLPKDLPADIPIYPGAKPTAVDITKGRKNTTRTSIVLQTPDSLDKVRAYYDKKITEHAWTVTKRFPTSVETSKDQRTLRVWSMEMPGKEGYVSINVIYTQPR